MNNMMQRWTLYACNLRYLQWWWFFLFFFMFIYVIYTT